MSAENTFEILACDFDGTLAHDGRVTEQTVAALLRIKSHGYKLMMVTGRELPSLAATFSHMDIFDRIVAENGALLLNPATGAMRKLAPSPPDTLLAYLTEHHVPFSIGHSIVATVSPYEHQVLEAIHSLGLEWHVVFNKGAVMVLPSTVTKTTGLLPAIEELGSSAERTIGIGDAENDHAFLAACGFSAAVSNALPSLKERVNLVTERDHGGGVEELIDRILDGTLIASSRPRRID